MGRSATLTASSVEPVVTMEISAEMPERATSICKTEDIGYVI